MKTLVLKLSVFCFCSLISCNAISNSRNNFEPNYIPLEELTRTTKLIGNDSQKSESKRVFETAMVENARDIGISNGYLSTMKSITDSMDKHKELFDRLLPFTEVIDLAVGDSTVNGRFIIPGIVTEIDKSYKINKNSDEIIIRQEDKTYLLKKQPRPSLRMPTWEDYVYDGGNLPPQKPIEALMPKSESEVQLYNKAIRTGWAMGKEQAISEIKDRLINAYVDLIGMARYERLYEEHYIERPTAVVTNVPVVQRGNELGLGTKYISLSGKAQWKTDAEDYDSPITVKKHKFRALIYQLIKDGAVDFDE